MSGRHLRGRMGTWGQKRPASATVALWPRKIEAVREVSLMWDGDAGGGHDQRKAREMVAFYDSPLEHQHLPTH